MPRVHINRPKYMQNDLIEFIEGRRRTLNLRQEDLGNEIGLSQTAFRNRMLKGLLCYSDLIKLFKVLQATDEEILKLMKL